MSKFTNFRDALTLEIGSWLLNKLISKLEDKYGRESDSGSDRGRSTETKDGNNGIETGQDRTKG